MQRERERERERGLLPIVRPVPARAPAPGRPLSMELIMHFSLCQNVAEILSIFLSVHCPSRPFVSSHFVVHL